MTTPALPPFRLFVVAGETSGDALAAAFVTELRARLAPRPVELIGIGGDKLIAAGLSPLFPMTDIAVMGFSAVIRRLPLLLRRIRETAVAAALARPDLVLTVDSPDFSLRVARRVRSMAPGVPIVHWVCPSVWAWRPARARAMRPHVDRLLALLPFEPEALARLDGPPTVFVGHPLAERPADWTPTEADAALRADTEMPRILLLPGSRRTEISRLLPVLRDVAARLTQAIPAARFILPAVSHHAPAIRADVASWPVPVDVVTGDAAKWQAFRQARIAIAASGTVTLELALAGIPTVSIYKVGAVEAAIARRLIRVDTASLPNLVLGRKIMPEFIQEACVPSAIAEAALALIPEGETRAAQVSPYAVLPRLLGGEGGSPARQAVEAALGAIAERLP